MASAIEMMNPWLAVSRRSVLRVLASTASVFALEGCASMAGTGARFDAAELTTNPMLLVATTRKPVNGARAKPWFGPDRAAKLSVARAKLTAPADGRFSLASIGLDDWRLDAIETVLRGETMVFSWPSKAKLFDYGYDRESAMWSRDALEQVLSGLITSPAVGRLHIVAHSIGTMLTMEAIRQIYDRHGGVVAERIGTVVFASPDIDIDVFSSSIERIGPLASKITVITSTNDRALAVSSWIAGGISRVGATEQAGLKRQGLHVIDASKQGWGIINHDLFLSNAQIRRVIRSAIDGQRTLGSDDRD